MQKFTLDEETALAAIRPHVTTTNQHPNDTKLALTYVGIESFLEILGKLDGEQFVEAEHFAFESRNNAFREFKNTVFGVAEGRDASAVKRKVSNSIDLIQRARDYIRSISYDRQHWKKGKKPANYSNEAVRRRNVGKMINDLEEFAAVLMENNPKRAEYFSKTIGAEVSETKITISELLNDTQIGHATVNEDVDKVWENTIRKKYGVMTLAYLVLLNQKALCAIELSPKTTTNGDDEGFMSNKTGAKIEGSALLEAISAECHSIMLTIDPIYEQTLALSSKNLDQNLLSVMKILKSYFDTKWKDSNDQTIRARFDRFYAANTTTAARSTEIILADSVSKWVKDTKTMTTHLMDLLDILKSVYYHFYPRDRDPHYMVESYHRAERSLVQKTAKLLQLLAKNDDYSKFLVSQSAKTNSVQKILEKINNMGAADFSKFFDGKNEFDYDTLSVKRLRDIVELAKTYAGEWKEFYQSLYANVPAILTGFDKETRIKQDLNNDWVAMERDYTSISTRYGNEKEESYLEKRLNIVTINGMSQTLERDNIAPILKKWHFDETRADLSIFSIFIANAAISAVLENPITVNTASPTSIFAKMCVSLLWTLGSYHAWLRLSAGNRSADTQIVSHITEKLKEQIANAEKSKDAAAVQAARKALDDEETKKWTVEQPAKPWTSYTGTTLAKTMIFMGIELCSMYLMTNDTDSLIPMTQVAVANAFVVGAASISSHVMLTNIDAAEKRNNKGMSWYVRAINKVLYFIVSGTAYDPHRNVDSPEAMKKKTFFTVENLREVMMRQAHKIMWNATVYHLAGTFILSEAKKAVFDSIIRNNVSVPNVFSMLMYFLWSGKEVVNPEKFERNVLTSFIQDLNLIDCPTCRDWEWSGIDAGPGMFTTLSYSAFMFLGWYAVVAFGLRPLLTTVSGIYAYAKSSIVVPTPQQNNRKDPFITDEEEATTTTNKYISQGSIVGFSAATVATMGTLVNHMKNVTVDYASGVPFYGKMANSFRYYTNGTYSPYVDNPQMTFDVVYEPMLHQFMLALKEMEYDNPSEMAKVLLPYLLAQPDILSNDTTELIEGMISIPYLVKTNQTGDAFLELTKKVTTQLQGLMENGKLGAAVVTNFHASNEVALKTNMIMRAFSIASVKTNFQALFGEGNDSLYIGILYANDNIMSANALVKFKPYLNKEAEYNFIGMFVNQTVATALAAAIFGGLGLKLTAGGIQQAADWAVQLAELFTSISTSEYLTKEAFIGTVSLAVFLYYNAGKMASPAWKAIKWLVDKLSGILASAPERLLSAYRLVWVAVVKIFGLVMHETVVEGGYYTYEPQITHIFGMVPVIYFVEDQSEVTEWEYESLLARLKTETESKEASGLVYITRLFSLRSRVQRARLGMLNTVSREADQLQSQQQYSQIILAIANFQDKINEINSIVERTKDQLNENRDELSVLVAKADRDQSEDDRIEELERTIDDQIIGINKLDEEVDDLEEFTRIYTIRKEAMERQQGVITNPTGGFHDFFDDDDEDDSDDEIAKLGNDIDAGIKSGGSSVKEPAKMEVPKKEGDKLKKILAPYLPYFKAYKSYIINRQLYNSILK